MRGKVTALVANVLLVRITPAHAGKRLLSNTKTARRGDHPRPCGEKCRHSPSRRLTPGSPPPMRGKGEWDEDENDEIRITPAHAGKSDQKQRGVGHDTDHPRPCGEKIASVAYMPVYLGSPPPMRGKAHRYAACSRRSGITPAHAGKRLLRTDGQIPARDHPRPCGEKSSHTPASCH